MMQYFVDTNVLLRAVAPQSAQHGTATRAIKALLASGEELSIAAQVVMEFWAVATRPLDVNGYGWTAAETEAQVNALLSQFSLLPETPAVFAEWLSLVRGIGVVGKQVHDAHIVAVMNIHGVRRLLTFNATDFAAYNVEIVSPESAVRI